MKLGGCLLQTLVFVALLPLVMAMPPLVFFLVAWMAFTAHYLRKNR